MRHTSAIVGVKVESTTALSIATPTALLLGARLTFTQVYRYSMSAFPFVFAATFHSHFHLHFENATINSLKRRQIGEIISATSL